MDYLIGEYDAFPTSLMETNHCKMEKMLVELNVEEEEEPRGVKEVESWS